MKMSSSTSSSPSSEGPNPWEEAWIRSPSKRLGVNPSVLRQLCVGESCLDIFRKLSPENEELVLRIGNEFEQYSKEMTNNPDYKEGLLANVGERARELIEKDVERTFSVFLTPEQSSDERMSAFRKVFETKLRHFLVISSAMTTHDYCQGWNFLAAGYLVSYDPELMWLVNRPSEVPVTDIASSAHSSHAFCCFYVSMVKRSLKTVYTWGPDLNAYMKGVLSSNISMFIAYACSCRVGAEPQHFQTENQRFKQPPCKVWDTKST
jgi:hypothetical protein